MIRALILSLLLWPMVAWAVPEDAEVLVLLPVVNGTAAPVAPFWKTSEGWTTDAEHWAAMGVVLEDGEQGKALSARALGVSLVIREEESSVLVAVPAQRLPVQRVGKTYPHAGAPLGEPDTGVLVNYNLAGRISSTGSQGASVGHEVRFNAFGGTVVSTGQANWDSEHGLDYVRGQSYWRRDDLERLRVYQLGDVFATAGDPVAMAGLRIARDPGALDPLRPTYPVPVLGGIALDPGTVRVLANESEILNEAIEAGPIEVDRYSLAPGATRATVVVRDRYGRETLVDEATLYVAPQLLRPGLTTWEVAAGAVRQGEDAYRGLGFSVAAARGINERWTLHGRAQIGESGHHAVAGTLVALGAAGVLEAELGASAGPAGSGSRVAVAYEYRARHASVRLEHERNEGWWRLAPDRAVGIEQSTRLRAHFRPNRALQWHVGLSDLRTPDYRYQTADLGLHYTRGPHAVGAQLLHDFQGRGSRVEVGYRYTFGQGQTATVRARQGQGSDAVAVGGTARGDVRGMPVFVAGEFERGAQGSRLQGMADWRTSVGDARIEVRSQAGDWSASGNFRGSVHLSSDGMSWNPSVPSAYAVVEVPGIAGVPVLLNGMVVGKTDQDGRLMIPGVSALVPQTVALDERALPPDIQVGDSRRVQMAPRLGGMRIRFPIASDSARGFIVRHRGALLPLGTEFRAGAMVALVGYDGLLYLQQTASGQVWVAEGLGCQVRIPDPLPAATETVELACGP